MDLVFSCSKTIRLVVIYVLNVGQSEYLRDLEKYLGTLRSLVLLGYFNVTCHDSKTAGRSI